MEKLLKAETQGKRVCEKRDKRVDKGNSR